MAETQGLDTFFTEKVGPLPVWGWTLLGTGAAYLYYRHEKSVSSSTASSTSTGTGTLSGFDYGPSIAAQQSEIQALQQGAASNASGAGSTTSSTGTSTSSTGTSTSTATAPSSTTGTSTTSTVTSSPSTTPSGANIAAGLVGTPLSQALATLQQNGITVNTVLGPGNVPVNPSSYSSTPVAAAQYFSTGQAGSNFANSVTLAV